ncbi:MAG: DUF3467 domain-containing protein [Candidatus Aenigmatarchaeota archaeon]
MSENKNEKNEQEKEETEEGEKQETIGKIEKRGDVTKEAFYTDSFSVLFNPNTFFLDLKQQTPRVVQDADDHKQKIKVHHKPVMMNPLLAKKLSHVLNQNLKKYEEKFGEIKPIGKDEKKDEESDEKKDLTYIG